MLILNWLHNYLILYSLVWLWNTVEILTWEHKQGTNCLSPGSLFWIRGPSLINYFSYRKLVHLCSLLAILSHLSICWSLLYSWGQSIIQCSRRGYYSNDLHWHNSLCLFICLSFILSYAHDNFEFVLFLFFHTKTLLSTVCPRVLSWMHFSVCHYLSQIPCIFLHIDTALFLPLPPPLPNHIIMRSFWNQTSFICDFCDKFLWCKPPLSSQNLFLFSIIYETFEL